MADDLTPSDGLSDLWIGFASMRVIEDVVIVDFDVYQNTGDGGQNGHVASIPIEVDNGNDGLAGIVVRAHDELINALRQMLYVANQSRAAYRKQLPR